MTTGWFSSLPGAGRANWWPVAATSLVLSVPPLAGAANAPSDGLSPATLKQMSIEQLLEMEVTSVARKEQPFWASASALTVLTAEDIHRSGALTLPEALRDAPGLDVARYSGRSYAISARGFNSVAADKLLVLMDGRSLYTPLFSGVFWDAQDTLLEDLDRIEVIRGPGATLWGANAMNGVINVITRSARDTQGTLVTGGAGVEEQGFGAVRYGGRAGEKTFYRAYAKYFDFDDQATPSGGEAGDRSRFGQGGFRLDSYLSGDNTLTAQGDFYYGLTGIFGRENADIHGGNFLTRWTRRISDDSSFHIQAYYDDSHRRVPLQFEEDRHTIDLEGQYRFPLAERHDVILGLNYRVSADETGMKGTFQFEPRDRTIQNVGGFVQDEIALVPDRLGLTLGSKFEYNDFSGFEYQPSARLGFRVTERQMIWSAVSRAVRTPTRIEDDVRFGPVLNGPPTVVGSRDFESEELTAYEVGYRVQPHARVSLDLAVYYNEYDRLRSQEPTPGTFFPLVLANNLEGESYGGEAALQLQVTDWWRWRASYGHLRKHLSLKPGSADPTGGAQEGNDPRHFAMFRSSMDLPHDVVFDAFLRYVDSRPQPHVPGYISLGLRLAWEPVRDLEFSIVGQNLLDGQEREWGPAGPTVPEVQRSVYGKVTWRF